MTELTEERYELAMERISQIPRENKRIAKLLELCGTKAVGICGMDMETPAIMLDNGYIPVIMPNDIDTENVEINPIDAALDVAVGLKADKLVYLSSHRGIWKDEARTEVYSRLTVAQVQEMLSQGRVTEGVLSRVERGLKAIERGVDRVNLLDGRMEHALLLEFFSVAAVEKQLQLVYEGKRWKDFRGESSL